SGVLPGRRDGELRRHMPLFRHVAERVGSHPAVESIVVPTLPALKARLEREVANWSVPVRVVADRAARSALYDRAVLALAVSGTVTLELALARLPSVVSYVLDTPQARIYERIGRPMVSLPNIILGRVAVPELVQASPDAPALVSIVLGLLDNKKARQDQIASFGELSD